MLRRAFLRRMAFAAAACAFFDVPLPRGRRVEVQRSIDGGASWQTLATGRVSEVDALGRLGVMFPGEGEDFCRAVINHARALA